MTTVTEHEAGQVARANASGRTPVVFVHGLWLLPSSWDRWAEMFETAGYNRPDTRVAGRPETTAQANADPEVFAGKSIGQVADHFAAIVGSLARKPAIIGHSFGGLLAQISRRTLLATASVAIDPAPFRGVLPLPMSALRSASAALGNPANRQRAVPLTYDQFRYAFANAVSADDAKRLYETFRGAAPACPSSRQRRQFNPWTEAKVDTDNPTAARCCSSPARRPYRPWAVTNAAYKRQQRNKNVTEIVEIPDAGTR